MDTYRTLSAPSSARYTVKMSRFLAFAYPVASEEEAKALIRKVANDYHDARHVCWAYMLGHDRSEEPFVDILMNSAVDAGVDPRHAIKILNPCQWWTVTKGENL